MLGTPYDDTIFGNGRDNTLVGGHGLDLIVGLGGNDLLAWSDTRTVLLDFEMLTIPGEHVHTQAERDAIQGQPTADYSAFGIGPDSDTIESSPPARREG